MKTRVLLLATLVCAQMATAVESKFIDDAPKGFIHVTVERYGAEVHQFIRISTVIRLEQFSEENDGKMAHYIRLYTPVTKGKIGGGLGAGNGELRQEFSQIEYATKEESDKVRDKMLELLSPKE